VKFSAQGRQRLDMELGVHVRRGGLSPAAVKMAAQGSANLGVLPQRVLLGGTLVLEDEAEEVQAAAYSLASRIHPFAAVPELQTLLDNVVSALGSGNLPGLVAAALSFLRRLPDDLIGHLAYRKDVFKAVLGLQEHRAEQICTMASFVLIELVEQLWRWAQGGRATSREFVTLAEANLRRTETFDLVADILKQFLEGTILGQDAARAASAATALGHLLKRHMPQARWVLEESVAHLFPHRGLAGPAFRFRKAMETGDADAEAALARNGAPSRLLCQKIMGLLKQRLGDLASRAFTGNCRAHGLLLSLTLAHILSQAQRPSPSVQALAEDWLRERVFTGLAMPGPSNDGFGGVSQVTDAAVMLLSTGALSRYRQSIAPILSLSLSGGIRSLSPPVDVESSFGGGLDDEQLRLVGLSIRCLSWISMPFSQTQGGRSPAWRDAKPVGEEGRDIELSWLAVASSCFGAALQPSNALVRVAMLAELFCVATIDAQRGGCLRCLSQPPGGRGASGKMLPLSRLLTLPWVLPLLQDALWESSPFRVEIFLCALFVTRRVLKCSKDAFQEQRPGRESALLAIPRGDGSRPAPFKPGLSDGALSGDPQTENYYRSLGLGVEVLVLCSSCLVWDWPHRAAPSDTASEKEDESRGCTASASLALCCEEYVSLLDDVCSTMVHALSDAPAETSVPKAPLRELADALASCIEDLVSWKLNEGVLVPQLRIRLCCVVSKHLASEVFADGVRLQLAGEILGRLEMDLFATQAQSYLRRHLRSGASRGALGGSDGGYSEEPGPSIYPMLSLRSADALTRCILPGVRYVARLSPSMRQACIRMLERRLNGEGPAQDAAPPDASMDLDASQKAKSTNRAENDTGSFDVSPVSDIFSAPALDPFGTSSLLDLAFSPESSATVATAAANKNTELLEAATDLPVGPSDRIASLDARRIHVSKTPVIMDGMFSRLGIRHNSPLPVHEEARGQTSFRKRDALKAGGLWSPRLPLHLRAMMEAALSELRREEPLGQGDPFGVSAQSTSVFASDGAPEAFLWTDPLSPCSYTRLSGAIEDVLQVHVPAPGSGSGEASTMPSSLASLFPLQPRMLRALLQMYGTVLSGDAVIPRGMLQSSSTVARELGMDDAGALLRFTESPWKVLNGGSDPVAIQVNHSFGREPEAHLFTVHVRVTNVSNTRLENMSVRIFCGRGLVLHQDIGSAGPMPMVTNSESSLQRARGDGGNAGQVRASGSGLRSSDSHASSNHRTPAATSAYPKGREGALEPISPYILAHRSQPLPSGANWDVICHARLLSDHDLLEGDAAYKQCDQYWIDVSVCFAGLDADPEDEAGGDEKFDLYLLGESEILGLHKPARFSTYDADDAAAFPDLPGQNRRSDGAERLQRTAMVRGERYSIPIQHTILPAPKAMRRWAVFQDLWNGFFFSYKGVQRGSDPGTFQLKAVNGRRSTDVKSCGSTLEANLSKLSSSLIFSTGVSSAAVSHLFECRREDGEEKKLWSEVRARSLLFTFLDGCTVALYARLIRVPGPSTSVSDSVWQIEFRSNCPLRFCQ